MIVASASVMAGMKEPRMRKAGDDSAPAIIRRRRPPRTAFQEHPPMFNRTTLWILLVAVAAGLGLWAAQHAFAPHAPAAPELRAVRLFPEPRPLPAFSLQQSDGTRLVPGELQGHWTVVFL